MLKGRGFLLSHPASNPHYLTRILDYYAVHWTAFNIDDTNYDPENDAGRLLTPLYVKDLKENFGGKVYGWGVHSTGRGIVQWLGLDGYLTVYFDGVTLTDTGIPNAASIPIIHLPAITSPPVFATYALAPAEALLEMTDLTPERVAEISTILRRSALG